LTYFRDIKPHVYPDRDLDLEGYVMYDVL